MQTKQTTPNVDSFISHAVPSNVMACFRNARRYLVGEIVKTHAMI